MPDLKWYRSRAAAMSPAELVWRTGAAMREAIPLFGPSPGSPARLNHAGLRAAVLDVASRESPDPAGTARRIAEGELSFWGRRADVDPRGIRWHVDPLTGEEWHGKSWRRTGRDPKPVWELNHQHHLVPLAVGAALAERRDWSRLVVEQALAWVEENPLGSGMGWASAYEASHRLITWSLAGPLVIEHASAEEHARLGAAVEEHRAYVQARPSRYSSANNHRLVELTALLAASLLTPGRIDWDSLWTELEAEAVSQTYADGGSREQAGGYFLYALEILSIASLLARAGDRELGRVGERISAMVGWLAATADEEWEPPPVGDDAEDRLFRVAYFEPRRADVLAARASAILGAPLPPRASISIVLPESGYAVLRAGDARVVFDIGELGFGALAAHGHADALAVLVDRGRDTLLRDTGTGSYVDARDEDRATAFHNSVLVDGESQAEPLGRHLWGRRYSATLESALLTPDADYVRASIVLTNGARHTRSLVRLGDEALVVFDRVQAPRPVRATLIWQPGSGLPEGPSVASDSPIERRELPGRFSPRYTWTYAAPRLVWPARGADIVFASGVPLREGPAPGLRLSRRETQAEVRIAGRRVIEDWQSPSVAVEPALS